MKKSLFFLMLSLCSIAAAGAAKGFHTSGTRLLDGNDKEFLMRGCNYSWAWQRGHESTVIPAAKRIGCNTIRIQLSTGAKWQRCSKDDLRKLIKLCEDNKLIAVFNTHDETGSNSISDLQKAADFWIEMKDVLNEHLSTVIVNISNEWCGDWNSSTWAAGYKDVIPRLRQAGILNTLMVDAAGWGQYPRCIADRGREVAAADSRSNLMFSVHIYDVAGKSDSEARASIDYALSAGVPAVVGEFAYEHKHLPVAWQEVLNYTKQKNVGYLVWSWTGNGNEVAACDMFGGYDDSNWKTNGTNTVKGTNGIAQTSKECSVFSQTPPDTPDTPDTPGQNETKEITLITPGTWFSSWDMEPVIIPASAFAGATADDELRIYYNASSGAEIQLAYTSADNNQWTETVPYKGISGSGYETQSLGSILRHVQKNGFFVKGHDFTFVKATLITKVPVNNPDTPDKPDTPDNPGQNAISNVGADGTEMPMEIFTLQGRRVNSMTPGHIYIIRQGGHTFRHLAR